MLDAGRTPRAVHLPAAGVVAVAVAVLVLGPEVLGEGGRLAGVALLQLALVAGWALGTGVEGAAGIAVVGTVAAAGADAALLRADRPELGGLLAVLGVAFLAGVFHQMLRRPRPELVPSLAAGVVLVCAVCAGAAPLLLPGPPVALWLAVGAALVAGHLVDLVLPRPAVAAGVPRGVPALLVAMVAAAAVVLVLDGGRDPVDALRSVTVGTVLGAVAALVSVAATFVLVDGVPPGDRRPRLWALLLLQAALPVAVCAPVVLGLHGVL